jgi:hypothetical protein
LDSCALRVLIVNDGDPLAIHLVVFLVIDPCSIEDIRADQHVLHEHIGIHHLEEGSGEQGGEIGGARAGTLILMSPSLKTSLSMLRKLKMKSSS